MEHTQDVELILNSLTKEKKELLDKVNEIDKVIKRIKFGNLNIRLSQGNDIAAPIAPHNEMQSQSTFPLKADLKVQIIKVFDILGVASKLREVQDKFTELTGSKHNIRESLRNLNKHQILRLLQEKGTHRGLYWVKSEWLTDEGTRLRDEHKFNGFDLLFNADTIEYK